MSYPTAPTSIDAFALMLIGDPDSKEDLLKAIEETNWPRSVRRIMQASVTDPESCGENLYKPIWYAILGYGFPDEEALVGPVGWKEKTRRAGGDKEVDIGVRIPVQLDASSRSKLPWLPIVLVELKDPGNWHKQSNRLDAHNQVQERGLYIMEKLNDNRRLSNKVENLKYIYILSVYGFNFKLYRLDTSSGLVFPVCPQRLDPTRTWDRPFQTEWKYHLLRAEGFDVIIAVFRYIYAQLASCGVTFERVPNLPDTGIALDTLAEFYPSTPDQPIPSNYHTPPDALSALMDPISLGDSTSLNHYEADYEDDDDQVRRRPKKVSPNSRQWNGYKGKNTAASAQSPVATRTRGQGSLFASAQTSFEPDSAALRAPSNVSPGQALFGPTLYAATPASFLQASPHANVARGSWQESPENDDSDGRYLAGMGGGLYVPNEAALKRNFAAVQRARKQFGDGSPEYRREGPSRR